MVIAKYRQGHSNVELVNKVEIVKKVNGWNSEQQMIMKLS